MHTLALIACAGLLIGTSLAHAQPPTQAAPASPPAQQPAAVPEKMPYDIPYGTPISLEAAKKLLVAAEAEAKKHNWKLNIAVVDGHGDLVAFSRMDGSQIASVTVSQRKAATSARYRRETRVFFNQFETGHTYVGTLDPDLVASPGGFPLISDGKLIGAIGCSGATGEQDAVVCKAAADTVK